MKNNYGVPQFMLRLALGIGFLLPVLDRLGLLGVAGENGNAWGNWPNFVAYTNTLMPYMNNAMASILAFMATLFEAVFGLALIIGYKIKMAALGSFLLTLLFALSMFVFAGPRAPFTYSVFVDSAASLLLAAIPAYKWCLDDVLSAS